MVHTILLPTNYLYRWFLIPHEIQYLFYTLYIIYVLRITIIKCLVFYIYILFYTLSINRRIAVLLFVCSFFYSINYF